MTANVVCTLTKAENLLWNLYCFTGGTESLYLQSKPTVEL